jgi:hypothetical protein
VLNCKPRRSLPTDDATKATGIVMRAALLLSPSLPGISNAVSSELITINPIPPTCCTNRATTRRASNKVKAHVTKLSRLSYLCPQRCSLLYGLRHTSARRLTAQQYRLSQRKTEYKHSFVRLLEKGIWACCTLDGTFRRLSLQ